jgi:hypothetical protein
VRTAAIASFGLIVALILLQLTPAGGAQLLVNGGFEGGTAGWSVTLGSLEAVADPNRSGSGAGHFSGSGLQAHEAYQFVNVQPGGTYELSGWVLNFDPAVERAFVRIRWFDQQGDRIDEVVSEALTQPDFAYRFLSTGARVAPAQARTARVGVIVIPNGGFSVYLDDFSLEGPALTPSPEPPPVPTAPPPTPTPTQAPTTPTPPTATTPPTAAPTESATQTPTATAVPTPARTRTPTPRPATPTPEPEVFAFLVNGSFEVLRSDGTPFGWRKIGGTMSSSVSASVDGMRALALTSATTSTKWAYQTVIVQGGHFYEATVHALKNDSNAAAVFLRISWYEAADGSGEALSTSDSVETLETNSPLFRRLTTGPVRAPAPANSARVRLMLRPASASEATALFDLATFRETEAPPQPTPTPTATPEPTASASTTSSPTGVPSDTPTSTATARQTPTLAPTLTPTRTPAATPSAQPDEPSVFAALTNGSFEETREDGTPYGWRKIGGEASTTDRLAADGDHSLAFTSRSGSTKWVYQTVLVQPGAYYQASAQAMSANHGSVFLRVSWYSTEDGSGQALGSDDSTASVEGASAAFEPLTLEPTRAPEEARSARVRLMLRPGSDVPTTVHFDDVRFEEAPAPPPQHTEAAAPRSATSPSVRSTPDAAPPTTTQVTPLPVALGEASTPMRLANVTPPPRPPIDDAQIGAGGDDWNDWALIIAVTTPLAALAAAAGYDIGRRRRGANPEGPD